jgi:exopolysaccharide production protein ExoQ
MKAMMALVLFAFLSSAWSQDGRLTAQNSIYLLVNTLFTFYIGVKFDAERQMRLMMLLGSVVATLCVGISVLAPQYGVDHVGHEGAWQGLFTQKNVCAQVIVFLATPVLYVHLSGRKGMLLRLLYGTLLSFVLVMTESRTGFLAATSFCAFAVMMRGLRRFRARERTVVIMATALFAATTIALIAVNLSSILPVIGRDFTLTGRSTIWNAVALSIGKHPCLGYGYSAFWPVLNGELFNVVLAAGWFVTGAHNGFLNLWLELGVVGVALFLMTLIKAAKDFKAAFSKTDARSVEWYVGLLFLTVVYNIDERTLMAPQALVWILYVLACMGLAGAASVARAKSGRVADQNCRIHRMINDERLR